MRHKAEVLERLFEEATGRLGARDAAKLLAFVESHDCYDKVLFVLLFSLLVRTLEKEEILTVICDEE